MRAELARRLGRTAALEEELHEPPASTPATLPPEDVLVRRALEARRDLAARREDVAGARARLTLAGRAWVPNPTLEIGYLQDSNTLERNDFSGDPDIVSGITGVVDDDSLLVIGLSFPLPFSSRRGAAQDAAFARVVAAEALLQQAEQAAVAQVREGVAAVVEAGAALDVLQRISGRLDENVALSRRGFEAGELDLSTWLLARNAAFDAMGEIIDARLASSSARAALESNVGGLQ